MMFLSRYSTTPSKDSFINKNYGLKLKILGKEKHFMFKNVVNYSSLNYHIVKIKKYRLVKSKALRMTSNQILSDR